MTSLADQLKQLQIPGKRNLQTSPYRVSILFDKKTAASLDNNAILDIGISGFNHLKTVEPLFLDFEESFFTKATVQIQRTMLEKSYEKKLKKKIAEFLILLSPYLQLQNSKKCLEWLIRRFEIHIFDKDALLQCIMPYHETQLFARIVQIISTEKVGSVWDHLLPKLKQGGTLNIKTLVHHCYENKSLLQFVCNMVEKASQLMEKLPRSGLQIIFSFYARLICGVADSIQQLSEEKLSVFIPIIDAGLSSGVKDYVCATYMLITIVLSKGKLKEKVTKRLLIQIIRSMKRDWYDCGLLCMISILHIYGTAALSSKLVQSLMTMDLDVLTESLAKLQQKYDIESFIGKLFYHVCVDIKKVDEVDKACAFLRSFLNKYTFKTEQLKSATCSLMEHYLYLENDEDDINDVLENVLKDISCRFSTIYDPCMNLKFSEYKDDLIKSTRLKRLAQLCLSKDKVQILDDVDLPLILCLNHPEKEFRCLAVKQLFSTFKSGVYDYDKTFFKESVLARLQDDDADVVNAVLKNPKSLNKLLSVEDMKPIIEKLSERTDYVFNLDSLYLNVVKNLGDLDSDVQKEFFFSILGQIFLGVSGKKFYKMVNFFQSEDLDTNNPVFNGIKEALAMYTDKETESSVINTYHLLTEKVALKTDWNFVLSMVKYCESLPQNHILHFVTLLILLENLSSACFSVNQIMSLNLLRYNSHHVPVDFLQTFNQCKSVKNVKSYIFQKIHKSMKENDTFDNQLTGMALAFLVKFILPKLKGEDLESRKNLFKLIVPTAMSGAKTKVKLPKKCKKSQEKTQDRSKELTVQVRIYQSLLKNYLEVQFADEQSTVDLLVNYCIELFLLEESNIDENSLELGVSLIGILKVMALSHGLTDKVVGVHLALLAFPHKTVRKVAVGNLNDFVSNNPKHKWKYIFSEIIQKLEEIILDQTLIVRLLGSKLNSKPETNKRNDFDVFPKKGRKIEKQKEDSLNCLKIAMKSFPFVLRTRLLEISKLVHFGDDCVDDIVDIVMEDDKVRSSINFCLCVLELITKQATISDENATFINNCLNCNRQEISIPAISMVCLLYEKLEKQKQLKTLRCLLDVITKSSYNVATKARTALKELKINVEHVCLLFSEACETIEQKIAKTKSEKNVAVIIDRDSLKESFNTIDELLVGINNRMITEDPNALIPAVFSVLERCFKLQDEKVEFTKQLCLSLLCYVTKESISKLSFHPFKLDLLLECLRTSDNTQTKENCLQVISSAAVLYPTHVLHNVMQIFTFMGGSFLKIDNEHSFNVIKETIHTIVPILLKKNQQSKKRPSSSSVDEIVMFVLQTFVDSCPHCPEHRRYFILSNLLKALGSEHLHKAMLLLIKKITDSSKEKLENTEELPAQEQNEYAPITLDFCFYFFSNFDVRDQLKALEHTVSYMMTVPLTIDQKQRKKQKSSNTLIDVQGEGEKQMRLFTYSVMSFLMLALQSDNLRNSYFNDHMKAEWEFQQLTDCYLGLSEVVIRYADKVEKEIESTTEGSIACKYGRKLFEKICKMMEVTFVQIPLVSFFSLVNGLLQKDLLVLRKKVLQLLADRMEYITEITEEQEIALVQIFSTVKNQLIKEHSKDTNYMQLLLFSVKVLVPTLSKNHPDAFADIIPFATRIYSNDASDVMVSINAMLVVAEMCTFMGVNVLSKLESIVTPVLNKIVEADVDVYRKDPLLLTCCLTSLHKIFGSVSKFMSPYVVPIIQRISICDSLHSTNDTLKNILKEFKKNVGQLTQTRILLPAVENFVDSVENPNMMFGVLEIFVLHLANMSATDVNVTFNDKIVLIFEKLLDKPFVTEADGLQNKIIDAFCALVLRMTEKSLRLVYVELYHWATSRQENMINERLLSFFRLSVAMGNKLQGLFLLFVSQLIEKCAELLEMYADDSSRNDFKTDINLHRNLLMSVVDCLTVIFRYDSHGYMNRERFQLVTKPLIDQMDCSLFDGVEDGYKNLISNHLLACIVHLASAVNDSVCWKTLNHMVLSKTKSANPKVRLAALEVIGKIYDSLGESFMVLVPETIPYLSEVLEDESFEVEEKCRKVIQQIEQITGESLQKYF